MAHRVSRRSFLSASSTTAAVLATGGLARRAAGASANEKLGLALIGCGGQGRYDAKRMLEAGGGAVELLAVADPDAGQSGDFVKEMSAKGSRPEVYEDFRKLLERKDVDLVVVGTPDHWHALATIMACQAGKDVYVEKPCSHNIKEGRAMVSAARKYERIVQVGQQQRSDAHFREAMEYLLKKKPLGRISRTLTMNYGNETPEGIGNPKDEDAPPKGVNYDLWLGPAPQRKFNRNRFHRYFRWFYDYAGGMLGDWNVHLQDIVHWGMDVNAPVAVMASGGKQVLSDNRETPDMLDVIYEYMGKDGPFTQLYTMSKVYQRGRYGPTYGTEFFGADGSLFIDRGGWQVTPETDQTEVDDPDQKGKKKKVNRPRTPAVKKPGGDSALAHARNFLECVRSRKWQDLHCDIEVGHRTASICHLGNISHRLGNKKIYWDAAKELITLQDGTPDAAANTWLTREYRKGFELPEV
jgi:predicted dehydrogenase